MKRILLTGLICLMPFSLSHAQPYWFYAVGGGAVNYDVPANTIAPFNVFLRGGLGLNEFLEIGIESSNSLRKDEINQTDYSVDTNLMFLKANLKVSENVRVYGLLGATSLELTGTVSNVDTTFDDSGVSYGFGIEVKSGTGPAYMIDYISYFDDDEFDGVATDVTVQSLNFGIVGRF